MSSLVNLEKGKRTREERKQEELAVKTKIGLREQIQCRYEEISNNTHENICLFPVILPVTDGFHA